jgi:sulfatase maturation enzyme AslB (radical SAM superfamily)
MTWKCAAIDHGVAIFPNGKIGPCCQISSDYLKPISEINNPTRFDDLKTDTPPLACKQCVQTEHRNIKSYRYFFNQRVTKNLGFQFVDIRNTNYCNLKCRYCGPHFSSQWADELGLDGITHQPIKQYQQTLITDSLQYVYFTGGEPLINPEHWELLNHLVDTGYSKNITLLYSTNLTTIKYKNTEIINLWNRFKSVHIQCSIDAIEKPLEYIRSGTTWSRIKTNLEKLQQQTSETNIVLTITPVLSILNLWFIAELFEYAKQQNIIVDPILLSGPDYLALDVIPDELTDLALEHVNRFSNYIDPALLDTIQGKINNNMNSCLFSHTLNHILLLDSIRGENLFDLLPTTFKELAKNNILRNHEYE